MLYLVVGFLQVSWLPPTGKSDTVISDPQHQPFHSSSAQISVKYKSTSINLAIFVTSSGDVCRVIVASKNSYKYYRRRHKRHQMAFSIHVWKIQASYHEGKIVTDLIRVCHQVASSLLALSSCIKYVKIRLVAT